MSENPLSCPKCHLNNLAKMPWGEWKGPSCGYSGKPTVRVKTYDLAEASSAKGNVSRPKSSIIWVTRTTFIKNGLC